MSEEINKKEGTDRQQLLEKIRTAPKLCTLMSPCTQRPYIACDPETFDDEIFIFFDDKEAANEAARLLKEEIPVAVAEFEQQYLLAFTAALYTMGVNAILVKQGETATTVQLPELVRRPKPEDLPEGKQLIENPELHLTALYYMQEFMRKPNDPKDPKFLELQEEIMANFGKGKYIFAISAEDHTSMPLIKLDKEKEDLFQPVFTDILEFQRFNQEKKLSPIIIDAEKIPQFVAKEAVGVLINPTGVKLPLTVKR